ILTTVYCGATEARALDALIDWGAQVKVSYDTQRTRLHAKAWLFRRTTGFSTAYIGSSNLSASALLDGLEWNVRLSAIENRHVLDQFGAAFEAYWQDPEFETYSHAERPRFQKAVHRHTTDGTDPILGLDLEPYPFQREILAKLEAERVLHGRWKNLVVAATGTGKTVVAARAISSSSPPRSPRATTHPPRCTGTTRSPPRSSTGSRRARRRRTR